MHGLIAQLDELQAISVSVTAKPPLADVLICTPATLLGRVVQLTAGRIGIGGHSERRQHHGETDAVVAAKAHAALRAGLLVILCIGETQAQRKDGNALSVCADQIAGSLPEGPICSGIAVAYEPLWAIGTGHVPTTEQIVQMHVHIRHCLGTRFGAGANAVRILYGGSVKPTNALKILALPEVNGALIGGASLQGAWKTMT